MAPEEGRNVRDKLFTKNIDCDFCDWNSSLLPTIPFAKEKLNNSNEQQD